MVLAQGWARLLVPVLVEELVQASERQLDHMRKLRKCHNEHSNILLRQGKSFRHLNQGVRIDTRHTDRRCTDLNRRNPLLCSIQGEQALEQALEQVLLAPELEQG